MDTFNNGCGPAQQAVAGREEGGELYHASVVRGCRELFSRTLLVANKWGGNSTGGLKGRRRREGPVNLFREGTRESESFDIV